MTAVVVQLRKRGSGSQSWSNQEIAEFYRVTEILGHAGIAIGIDGGVTDEGDPWQVFFREDTGDILAHFAKIDGDYVIACPPTGDVLRGSDLRDMVASMMRRQPVLMAKADKSKSNVYLHPAMVLSTFIVMAYLLAVDASEARAADAGEFFRDAEAGPQDFAAQAAPQAASHSHDDPAPAVSQLHGAQPVPVPAKKIETPAFAERYIATMTSVVAAAASILGNSSAEADWLAGAVAPDSLKPGDKPLAGTASAARSSVDALPVAEKHDGAQPQRQTTHPLASDAQGDGPAVPPTPQQHIENLLTPSAATLVVPREVLSTEQRAFLPLPGGEPHLSPQEAIQLADFSTEIQPGEETSQPASAATVRLTIPASPVTVKIPENGNVILIGAERLSGVVADVQNAVEIHFQSLFQLPPFAQGNVQVATAEPQATVKTDTTTSDAAPDSSQNATPPAASPAEPVSTQTGGTAGAGTSGGGTKAPASGPTPPAAGPAEPQPPVIKVDQAHNTASLHKGADVVVYSGGSVTLHGFELGVDKLVIDGDKVDASHLTAKWTSGGELLIDFGGGMTVKMVGLVGNGLSF